MFGWEVDKSVGIPKAQNPALSLIFRRLCVPVASVMDVHEVGSSDAYFKPLNSLLRCPMHLQAPCEVVYRSPISIKGKSSMSLADIYDAVPVGFEAWFAYQAWQATIRCECAYLMPCIMLLQVGPSSAICS